MIKRFFHAAMPAVAILFIIFSAFNLEAQTFRVHKTVEAQISISSEPVSVQLGINDALAVMLPENKTYLQGLSIEMKIPAMVAAWRDSMAWSLFDAISPHPSSAVIDYSGTSIASGVLPARLSLTVVIPLKKDNTIKDSPYVEKINLIPNTSSNLLFLRLQQAMKGTPENFDDNMFDITIKPILINKGSLILAIEAPSGGTAAPCSLFLDEKPFTPEKDGNLVETGVHSFSLVSEYYRNEVRTIHVEQAKTTTLAIKLRSIDPTVIISAPATAAVSFDDVPLTDISKEFVITEGEHTVHFILGNYDVIKTFTAVKGQSYTVSLNIEAVITEEN